MSAFVLTARSCAAETHPVAPLFNSRKIPLKKCLPMQPELRSFPEPTGRGHDHPHEIRIRDGEGSDEFRRASSDLIDTLIPWAGLPARNKEESSRSGGLVFVSWEPAPREPLY